MKKQLFTIATGLSLSAAGLMAQGTFTTTSDAQMVSGFQQAGTIGTATVPVRMPAMGGGRGSLVTGSPVSAKEVNKTVQTLSDGTELENTQTTMFYRDSQGRTRTESSGNNGMVMIVDPVAGVRITLNPSTKTAVRMAAPGMAMATTETRMAARGGSGTGGGAGAGSGAGFGNATATIATLSDVQKMEAEMTALRAVAGGLETARTVSKQQSNTEDLGFQMQNGILAQGTRTTLTIPKGQIGNNKDIHVVNERWYSKDLQMVVKSVNSDPRFGTTTYDMTNIVQGADPTLFQIPGNYTVTEGGRGGRGGTLVPAVKQ
jgi:hypothetical protein